VSEGTICDKNHASWSLGVASQTFAKIFSKEREEREEREKRKKGTKFLFGGHEDISHVGFFAEDRKMGDNIHRGHISSNNTYSRISLSFFSLFLSQKHF